MIEDVEDFGAELNVEPFQNPGILRQRDVHGFVAGRRHRILSEVAHGSGRRQREAGLVEPVLRGLTRRHIATGNDVGTNRGEVIRKQRAVISDAD